MTPELTKLIEEKAKQECDFCHREKKYNKALQSYEWECRQAFKDGATFALSPEVLIKVPEVRALVDTLTNNCDCKNEKQLWGDHIICSFCESLAPFARYMEGES